MIKLSSLIEITSFHGSGNKFDTFDSSFSGKGIAKHGQAFGDGFSFVNTLDKATKYAKLTKSRTPTVYQVELLIDDSQFFNFDAPVDANEVTKLGITTDATTNKQLYDELKFERGSRVARSIIEHGLGYKGIVYKLGNDVNHIVFNPKHIKIIKKFTV